MTEPLLEVSDLEIASGAGPIVAGLGFEIRPGETIGIVGESGSGKSLTARALVGLLPPGVTARGTVRLGGVDLLAQRERDWRRIRGSEIALLLQDPFTMLSPLMRVGPQITETLRRADRRRRPGRAVRRAEAVRRLHEVGIRDQAVVDRFPFQLSGGMRQRVGLAAALASDPGILIADEPSTALDVTTQREILRLIRSVQRARGMAVILITHDLRVAFSMCDRIYVLYAGMLLEVAPALDLERTPLHPYTHGLLESEPPLEARLPRLHAIPGSVPVASEVLDRCAFAGRCAWTKPECIASRPLLAEVDTGRLTACVRIAQIRRELEVVPRPARPSTAAVERAGDTLIRVVDVVKQFGHAEHVTRALDGVSLTVNAGDSVGIVGESGSGKTTLARCIVGLERATAGTVEIAGRDATDRERLPSVEQTLVRNTVQMVFQDPYSTLNPSRSIGFTLREALRYGPARPASFDREVSELLERVGLPAHFSARKPASLSGGERQRVAIARALALRPRVLICDEPVSALDVSVQAQILNLFGELRETLGLAYVFITHDLAVVRQVADRVQVLHNGRIVEEGPTATVLEEARDDYTRALIGSVPRSDPAWLDIPALRVPST